MQDVVIIADTVTDITEDLARELGVVLCPVHVIIDDVDYRDRFDISPEEFYALLPTLPTIPTTSGSNVADFLECYQQGMEMGKSLVSLVVPDKLSVTYKSAVSARELVLMETPDADITVVDLHTVSTPEGLMVMAAARAAREGKGKQEILALVEELIPRTGFFFTSDTIEYLEKGGRRGPTEKLLGSLEGFRPIIKGGNDLLMPVDKAETREASIARLLELMEEDVGPGAEVVAGVVHALVPDEAADLREAVEARFRCREMHTFVLGPIAGTHFGPGSIGVGYYTVD